MNRMPRWTTAAVGAAGVALVAVAAPLSYVLASTTIGRDWTQVVDDTMSDRTGVWRLLRGGFAYLTIPALLLGLAVLLVVTYRRSPRAAWVLAGTSLAGNVTVQLIKHPPPGIVAWLPLDPLSGHVGVAASICLGWLVVAPVARRLRFAVVAALVIAAVAWGMLLAGWHSPFQILCPLLICAGWALVGRAVLLIRPVEGRPSVVGGVAALVVGIVVSGATWWYVMGPALPFTRIGPEPVVLALVWVTGVSVGVVGLVLAVASLGAPASAPDRVVPGRVPQAVGPAT
jgi:hypothetical protein